MSVPFMTINYFNHLATKKRLPITICYIFLQTDIQCFGNLVPKHVIMFNNSFEMLVLELSYQHAAAINFMFSAKIFRLAIGYGP